MPERERRVFVPKGKKVRLVLEGGSIVDISHLSPTFKLEQKSPDSREARREQLKALYPRILLPHVRARLDQHGYSTVGGEEISGEMGLMETEKQLKNWMQDARNSGISNQEIREETSAILEQVMIGAPRIGKTSPLVNGIGTEISSLVDEVWGIKKKKG